MGSRGHRTFNIFSKRTALSVFFFLVATLFAWGGSALALPVTPGAAGYGTDTIAGRGGKVYRVTSLANTNTPGTLRYALGQNEPRTIIFEVSGTIEVNGYLDIPYPYVTVAGQTAPSPGIFLKGATIRIMTHDVLLQHLRAAPGDGPGPVPPNNRDALAITSPYGVKAERIVIDHCTFTWSIDELFETWGPAGDITFRNVLAAEPLHDSIHIDEGQTTPAPHGFGPVFDNQPDSPITVYGSLFSHAEGRLPYAMSSEYVQVNNVFYDRINTMNRLAAQRGLPTKNSLVGNIFKEGPSLASWATGNKPIELSSTFVAGGQLYLQDNDWIGFEETSQWDLVSNKTSAGLTREQVEVAEPPAWNEGLVVRPANETFDWVLSQAGARPADRLPYEQRIVDNARNGTGRVVNSVKDEAGNVIPLGDVGGWPVVAEHHRELVIPKNPSADDDGDGYTNLEEWLESYAAFVEGRGPEPQPIPPEDGEPREDPEPEPEPGDPVLIRDLWVDSRVIGADTWSIRTNLQEGDSVYTDRIFTFVDIPDSLVGSEWIQGTNDAKRFIEDPILFRFRVVEDADVYVAVDDRNNPRPTWIGEWADTGEDLIVASPPLLTYSLYKKSFPAGTLIEMGNNNNRSGIQYLTIVKPKAESVAGTGTAVVVSPANGSTLYAEPAEVAGRAYDPDSANAAIADIRVSIRQDATGLFLNAAGNAFDAPQAVYHSVYGSYDRHLGGWSLGVADAPFANGSYTVTAVVDDGVEGAPAVASFSVARPAATLHGDEATPEEQSFHIRLTLNDVPPDVTEGTFDLEYDAQLFELVSVQAASPDITVTEASYDDTPGAAHIVTSHAAGSGDGDVLDLEFRAKPADSGASGVIRITGAALAVSSGEEPIPAATGEITIRVTIREDVNGDGNVNVSDLLLAVRYLGKTSGSPDWAEAQAADVDRDGVVGPLDIARIAKKLLPF
jgi:hypothetical protein